MQNPNELTPGPWRWKFNSTAGSYFLYGSGGDGPMAHTGPDSADGRLQEAAPLLLAALEMVQRHKRRGRAVVFSGEEWTQIDTAIAAACPEPVEGQGEKNNPY